MSIIMSSIKRSLRDKNTILAVVFLVVLLPYIFSLIFSFQVKNEDIKLSIVGDKNSQIISPYIDMIKTFDKDNEKINITYTISDIDSYQSNINKKSDTKLDNSSRSLTDEEINKDDLTIIIDEENNKVLFKGSNTLSFGEIAIEGMTEEYFNQVSTFEMIARSGNVPKVSSNLIKISKNESSDTTNINNNDMDYEVYYSIAMLQMATLMGAIYAFKNTFYLKENIGSRVKSSPMKMSKLLSLELIGSFSIIFIQSVVILLAISMLYGVQINSKNILGILALQSAISLLAVSIGVFSTAIAKKKTSGENICSVIITVMTIVSGQLMPHMNLDFDTMWYLRINPFAFINREMISLAINNTSENLYSTLGLSAVWAVVFMMLATIILRRKVVK